MLPQKDIKMLDAMLVYGDPFTQQLRKLLMVADEANYKKIESAYTALFAEHRTLGEKL